MLHFHANKGVQFCDGLTRRDFLKVGALSAGAVGLSLADLRGGQEYPHYGSVVSQLRGRKTDGLPPFVILPSPIGNTGVSVSHGQGAGYLGSRHEPFFLRGDPAATGFQITDLNAPSGIDPAR